MLARDWYYTQRRRVGLDTAVASIYAPQDDVDVRARSNQRFRLHDVADADRAMQGRRAVRRRGIRSGRQWFTHLPTSAGATSTIPHVRVLRRAPRASKPIDITNVHRADSTRSPSRNCSSNGEVTNPSINATKNNATG